ncbi:MAG: tRNA pseudouridine(38-40) synthase TruA [Deltaproteobacteria bacterium]|nr:tRNA pseudouridine(38-40) synthase TruA [Deltaproteobacteria bacterium]
MKKFAALLEYDGTCYHGWQLQSGAPTIQEALESVLERILGKATRVHGAGRTDAGVHATGQVAHFVADWQHTEQDLQRACNALLPVDITVMGVRSAAADFHARHSARSKTYAYRILNRPLRSSLMRAYSWHVPRPLDPTAMEKAAQALVGTHDFAAFGAPTDGAPSTVRKVLEVCWQRDEGSDILRFTIRGSGFLRRMVRSIVGTLVPVGLGKMDPEEFLSILDSRDRSRAGATAPPYGLCLEWVEYQDMLFHKGDT